MVVPFNLLWSHFFPVFRRVRRIAKNDYKIRHVYLCVHPSVCLYVCLTVRMCVCPYAWNNAVHTERIFMKFGNWIFFEKSVENIQIRLESEKSNGYSTKRRMDI